MIYVTLPVYNEQRTVGVLLWRIRQVFAELNRDFRLLVLDDGSTDETPEVVEPYRRVLPLTVLRNERRAGYAAALEALIREAVGLSRYPKRDGLLVMQADFTDGPEMIPAMLRPFQGGADLVAGRPVGPRGAPRAVRLARLGAAMISLPEGVLSEVGDPFCSFRLYRLVVLKRALRELPDGDSRLLHHQGWAANAELLAGVAPHVRRWEQVDVPVNYSRRYRSSRVRALPEVWNLFRATRDSRLKSNGQTTASAGT